MKHKVFFMFIIFILPFNVSASEFLNTLIHVNIGGSYGIINGDVINQEHDELKDDEFNLLKHHNSDNTENPYTRTYKRDEIEPSHRAYSFGVNIDIVPFKPILLGRDSHAFKFGVRWGYHFNFIDQTLTLYDGSNQEDTYSGSLIEFDGMVYGPVIHYAPFVDSSNMYGNYTASWGLTFYFLYGQIRSGKIYSRPVSRKLQEDTISSHPGVKKLDELYNFQNDRADNYTPDDTSDDIASENLVTSDNKKTYTKITGYRTIFGIGGEVSTCSVNIGFNLFYQFVLLEMDEQLYDSISKKTSIQTWNIEMYVGLPIIWNRGKRTFW